MATITSLDFNIGSHWDGTGVREARNDIDALVAQLRVLSETRATAHVEVDVDNHDLNIVRRQLEAMEAEHHTIHVDVDTETAGSNIHRLVGEMDGADSGAHRLGGSMGGLNGAMGNTGSAASVAGGGISGLTSGVGLLVLAMMAIGPVAALASAVMIGTLGGGFIAVAAAVLLYQGTLDKSMQFTTGVVQDTVNSSVALLNGPMNDAIVSLGKAFVTIEPLVRQAFAATGPLIKPMADALANFGTSIMPGVVAALQAALPIFNGLASGMKGLGEGISNMFAGMANGAEGAGAALGTFLSYTGQILGVVGQAFGAMSDAGSRALGGLMSGLLSVVSGGMTGFVGAVKAMDGTLGPFLATVGKVVGTILAQMLPVFGQIVSVLMQALMPVLRAVTPALTMMGTALGGTIVTALKTLAPALGQLAVTLGSVMIALTPLIPPLTKILIAGLQLFVAVLKPLLPLVTELAKLIALLAPVINLAAKGIGLMSQAIQAGIRWITDWSARLQNFKTIWSTIWNSIKSASDTVWNAMKAAWSATINGLITAWNTISNGLKTAWSNTWNTMKQVAQTIWTALQTAWNTVMTTLRTIMQTGMTAMQTAWNTVWNGIKTAAQAVWTALQTAWNTVMNAMKTTMSTVMAAMQAAWSAAWNAIKAAAQAVWAALQAAWTTVTNAMKVASDAFLNAVKAAWSAAWNAIKAAAEAVWNALKSAADAVWNAMKTATDTFLNAVKTAWQTGWNAVKTAFETVINGIKSAYDTFSRNLVSAVKTTVSDIKTAWNAVEEAFKAPIHFVIATVINGGLIKAANWVIDKLGGGGSTIPDAPVPFASGGYVSGPGSGTSDSIPARLSNGEFVMKASSVNKIGVDALNNMNQTGAAFGGQLNLANSPQLAEAFGMSGGAGSFPGMADGGFTDDDLLALFEDSIKAAGGVAADLMGKLIGDAGNVAGDIVGAIGGLFGHPNAGDSLKAAASAVQAAFGLLEDKALGGLTDDLINLIGTKLVPGMDGSAKGGPLGGMGLGFGKTAVKALLSGIKDSLLNFLTDQHTKAAAIYAQSVAVTQPVAAWAPVILEALALVGMPLSLVGDVEGLMQSESGGNPNAINLTDINAQNGVPSQGLMQVIPPTFAAYHVAGTSNNILDPLANIAAALNYIKSVYGGVIPGSPYATGTGAATQGWHMVGENGPEMRWFDGGEAVWTAKESEKWQHRNHDWRGHKWSGSGGGSQQVEHNEDNSVNFHDGAFQFNVSGQNAEQIAQTMQSEEVLGKLRKAVQAGVGKKVG